MKAIKCLVGLLVLGGAGYGYYWMRSNDVRLPIDKPKEVRLTAGTPIQLIVLEPLSSGGSEVGESVKLIVAEDVKIGKDVVIRKGTEATGKVSKSRSGSLVGAFSNQPARLEMTLVEVVVGKQKVPIRSTAGEVYAFTQANTVRKTNEADLDAALKDPEKRAMLEEIAKKLGGDSDVSVTDLVGLDLKGMNDTFDLPETDSFLDHLSGVRPGKQEGEEAPESVERVLSGLVSGSVTDIVGIDRVLAARALGEISNLGRKADQKIRGIFKGRNIWVEIGTPVSAKVAKDIVIKS